MSDGWSTFVTVVTGVACLVIGYLAGYRSGIVAGELQALKSSLRDDSSRRHRNGGYESGRCGPKASRGRRAQFSGRLTVCGHCLGLPLHSAKS